MAKCRQWKNLRFDYWKVLLRLSATSPKHWRSTIKAFTQRLAKVIEPSEQGKTDYGLRYELAIFQSVAIVTFLFFATITVKLLIRVSRVRTPGGALQKYRFYSIGYGVGAFFMFEFKFKILKKITKSSQKNQHSPLDSANEQVYNVVRTKEEGTKEKERFPEFLNLLVPKKQG